MAKESWFLILTAIGVALVSLGYGVNPKLGMPLLYGIDIESVNCEEFDDCDWVGAFNGDVCVGAVQWNTDDCLNGICSINVMGYASDLTSGYMQSGDTPTFKIYDYSEDTYYDATEEKPPIVGITSSSIGTINPINPEIRLYKDCSAVFDVSDSSLSYVNQATTYSAFNLSLVIELLKHSIAFFKFPMS